MKKIVKTLNIEDFEKKVPTSAYPKFFSQKEIEKYSHKKSKGSLAVRFLLKQILQDNITNINYTDIEILNTTQGVPILKLTKAHENWKNRIYFSLSHTKYEVAVLLIRACP